MPIDFSRKCDATYIVKKVNEEVIKNLMDYGENSCWVVWAKLIHKDIVQSHLFHEGKIYEDSAVVCKWIYYAEYISLCDNRMYFYYINNEGTTKSKYSLKKLDSLWALEEQIKFYKNISYSMIHAKLCSIYILKIAKAYNSVYFVLKNKSVARKIRNKMIKFILNNRKSINISRQDRIDICNLMFPKTIHLLWKIKHCCS